MNYDQLSNSQKEFADMLPVTSHISRLTVTIYYLNKVMEVSSDCHLAQTCCQPSSPRVQETIKRHHYHHHHLITFNYLFI